MFKSRQLTRIKAGPSAGLAEGEFTAYAAVFGNIDQAGDVIVRGAFADTLTEWKASEAVLPLLWGHDMTDPFSNIGHVIEATEDDHGLLVKAQLDLANTKGEQVYRMLKGRRINQMSFAFSTLDGGPATRKAADGTTERFNELRKLQLHEVSIVPLGCNPRTEILAVKHFAHAMKAAEAADDQQLTEGDLQALQDARDAIDGILANHAPDDADDPAEPDPAAPSAAAKSYWATRLRLLDLDAPA